MLNKHKKNFIKLALYIPLLLFVAGCGGGEEGVDSPLLSLGLTQWNQADWSGGVGPSTTDQYSGATNIDTATPNQITLSLLTDWFDADWDYRRPISIANPLNANALTEYQVLIEGVDTASLIAAGKMQADCDDIRFASTNAVALDYFIIGDSCNTANTSMWVKMDMIPATSSTTLYLYYGNSAAASFQSEANTFSYSSPRTVGIVGSALLASTTLDVISLADGNTISDGTSQLNLNEQGTGTFPAAELSIGTEITANDLFYADGSGDGVDMLTPISYAGTLFIHYSNRYDHFYRIYSHWSDAQVTVYLNGAVNFSGTINQGASQLVNTGSYDDRTVRIESDVPVHVFHYAVNGAANYDAVVLYPATDADLYGIPSNYLNVAAGASGANVSWIKDDGTAPGSPQALGADGRYESAALGAQGTAGAFRVSTDQAIGVNQIADADGGESVSFWPLKEMGTKFGANGIVQYVTVAASQPSTTCTVYDSGGGIPANPEPGFTNPYTGGVRDDVNFLYFGDSAPATHSWLTAGWMMECDKPVYAYYELDEGTGSAPDDEHNMWSYPQMRQFTYPTPSVGSLGAEQEKYPTAGSLTSNAFDSGELGSRWNVINFVTDDETNTIVKVRTSDDPSMSGAPAFSSCDAVTDGSDLSTNNCVTDGDRYVQYLISFTSTGLATPTFTSITINFNPIEAVQADAGPDQIVVSGRQTTLDGTGSTGEGLTYTWAIIEGSGTLTDETTATPIYSSSALSANEDVLVHLTVRDEFGERSTDDMTIHLLTTAEGIGISDVIAANANGTIVYEKDYTDGTGNLRISLETTDAAIHLPEGARSYALAFTSDNRMLIGLPYMDEDAGHVYLINRPIQSVTGTIDLEDAVPYQVADVTLPIDLGGEGEGESVVAISGNQPGDMLGRYLAAGDLNGNGFDTILIAATGAGSYGWAYVYDTDLQFKGVLIGTAEFPVHSVFTANFLTTVADDIIFGPGNTALNANLTRGAFDSAQLLNYAFVIAGTEDLTGVSIIDSFIVDLLIGEGNTYQALAHGDVNGDGLIDVVLASNDGNVYIFFGPVDETADLSIANANEVITGGAGADGFGHMLAIGDVNGDGFTDLIIGAPEYGDQDAGAVYIIFRQATFDNPLDVTTSPNVMIVSGADSGDGIGGDLLLADLDQNGSNEIYTVKQFETIFKIDLSDPHPRIITGGKCSLTAYTQESHLVLLFVLLLFSALTILVFFKHRRFIIST